MGKSYNDNTKQPKKPSGSKIIRIRYEEEEAERDIKNYTGVSFLTVLKENKED